MKSVFTKAKKFVKQLQKASSFGNKPSVIQLLNIVILGLKHSFSPLEYYLYGFFKKTISRQEKLSYISNERIERKLRPALNHRRWIPILENKLFFFIYYSQFNLPVVKVYGFYYPDSGFMFDGSPMRNKDDFAKWFLKTKIQSLVIKPISSLGGKGIKIFDEIISENSFKSNEGKTYSSDEMFSFMNEDIEKRQKSEDPYTGFIVEEKIEQAREMNVLRGKSLNTVRVSTLRTKGGEVVVDFAMLRVGRKDSITDNLHQGGYVVNLDVRNGKLAEEAFGYIGEKGPWVEEKDVNIKKYFKDGKIPNWSKIAALANRAALISPNLFSVGWDIALSEDGPVLIEGNENWDMVIAQVLAGGYLTERRREILRGYGLEFP